MLLVVRQVDEPDTGTNRCYGMERVWLARLGPTSLHDKTLILSPLKKIMFASHIMLVPLEPSSTEQSSPSSITLATHTHTHLPCSRFRTHTHTLTLVSPCAGFSSTSWLGTRLSYPDDRGKILRSRATYPYPRPRGRHPGGRREIDYRPAACNEACGSRNIHRPWLTAENESDDLSSGLSAHPTIRKVLSSKFKSAKNNNGRSPTAMCIPSYRCYVQAKLGRCGELHY